MKQQMAFLIVFISLVFSGTQSFAETFMSCPDILNANIHGLASQSYRNVFPEVQTTDFIKIMSDKGSYGLTQDCAFCLDSVANARLTSEDDEEMKFYYHVDQGRTQFIYGTFNKAQSTLEVRIINATYVIPVEHLHYLLKCHPGN